MRGKFLNTKLDRDLEKKLKSYKKDLDTNFKGKIKELDNLTNNQAEYNSLISKLISNMSLDENLDDENIKMKK